MGNYDTAGDIFSEKFYSLRKPAWHGLGHVSATEESIHEAVKHLDGLPQILKMPIYLHGRHHQVQIPNSQAVVGVCNGHHEKGVYLEDNNTTLFTYGIVSDDYVPITHEQLCDIWHRSTNGASVETVGVLAKGATLFISTTLPSFDIKGDEHTNYLFLTNTVDGMTSVRARPTTVRVVCANTQAMALREHQEQYFRYNHRQGVMEALESWISELWQSRTESLEVVKEALELLSSRPVTQVQWNTAVKAVYPLPDKPQRITQTWEEAVLSQQRHQNNVIALLQGASPTLNTQATSGTLYGLYQAFSEYEGFGRKKVSAQSATFGSAFSRIQKGFEVCMSMV